MVIYIDMTIVPHEVVVPAIVLVDIVPAIVLPCIVYRRDGTCPLHPGLIKQILEYIHGDLRFTLTRHGLGDANEPIPTKLSIHAIINARLMDYFRDVLLGPLLREETWPIVESNAMYDDVVPWLQANRCPRMYTAITVLTANDYGIYTYVIAEEADENEDEDEDEDEDVNSARYEGDWKDGMKHGQGRITFTDDDEYDEIIYEGSWVDNAKCVYVGFFENDEYHGQGTLINANGSVYVGVFGHDKIDL
jgi:hypothetical protein